MGPPKNERNQLFLGTFIHSKKLDELEYLHEAAICVDKDGKIAAVEQPCDRQKAEQTLFPKLGWEAAEVQVTTCKDGQFFFPGFIDTHLHAPQYPNVGIFGKSTLLDWLNKYTFPMEASMGTSPERARRVYGRVVRRTLAHGTTTASYYATIDVAATNMLADICMAAGQRALVGRVCMDHPSMAPDYYRDEDAEQSLERTRASIAYIQQIDPAGELVRPVLTPRFAPSCTEDALARLGALQRETGLPVQTHICENPAEIQLVHELFPAARSYADVYDRAGLLCDKTILAHAVHLTDEEADLIASRGAKVSHCPCSNSALTSGEARVRWMLDKGIRVGLGTDMSGGYSPSILEAARLASLVSRHLAMAIKGTAVEPAALAALRQEKERAALSVEEVLYLATRGGSEVVGLKDRIGGFNVGLEWDAQLIGLGDVEQEVLEQDAVDFGNVDVFGWETWEEKIAKWVFNGDDRNVKNVWVKGRLVHTR